MTSSTGEDDASIRPGGRLQDGRATGPSSGICFDSATIERTEARSWHPGERMEGTVLVPATLLEAPGRLMEIRVVLRRVIHFPSSISQTDSDDLYSNLAELGPFRSEQCSIADHIIYGARGPRGAEWRGTPHASTDLLELQYSLLLPADDSSKANVAPLPGLVDFDLVVTISQQVDGSNARVAAAVENVRVALWDKSEVQRVLEPLEIAANGSPKTLLGWKKVEHGIAVEGYPGAPPERHADLVMNLYTPNQAFAAGGTYPVGILLFVRGPTEGTLEKVDWRHILPDLPHHGHQNERLRICLETYIEYQPQLEAAPVKRVRLPQFDLPGRWSSGHEESKTTRDWVGRPCEGFGWQKPLLGRSSKRWVRYAHLVARITVPDDHPPSFELTTNLGGTVRLRHRIKMQIYVEREQRYDGVVSSFCTLEADVSTTSGHVPDDDDEDAPPTYVA